MPPFFNNVSTQNTYVDALTAQFTPRKEFTCHVFNNAIYYQLGYVREGYPGDSVTWENGEHQLAPSYTNFRNPQGEGLPPGTLFAGIRVRSAVTNAVAQVTVIA